MKQVIWIVGTSSAGKQTFMKTILSDPALRERLGLQDKTIAICQRSVDFPGDSTMPEIVKERELIPRDVASLLNTNDVVVIKWQYVDSLYSIPMKLAGSVLNVEYKIILLKTNEAESINRLDQKEWWKSKGFATAKELFDYENRMIDIYTTELAAHFDTTVLDSSNGADYSQLPIS